MKKFRMMALIKKFLMEYRFWHELRDKYEKLLVKRRLTLRQKKEIQTFYKKAIGRRIPLIWHKFLYSRTGIYSPYYIPVGVYRTEMIGRMNNFPFKDAYADKNVAEMLFPDVVQPRTFIKNINRHFYAAGKAISKEKAIEVCRDLYSLEREWE